MTLNDTSPDAQEKQIEILRSKSNSERLALTLSLSDTVIHLSKRAIKRANPEISDEEVRCLFVEFHYGKPLADKLRLYLDGRKHGY